MVNVNNLYIIETRRKSYQEMSDMRDWLDENYIQYRYMGNRRYEIEGEADATMTKLVWG